MRKRLAQQDMVSGVARAKAEKHSRDHVAAKSQWITEFAQGSYVLLAWPITRMAPNGRPTKLDALYRGPYKVLSSKGDTYKLLNLVTGKTETDKSIHSLKIFKYDAARTSPRDVALKDFKDQFLVEAILDYSGRWNRIGTLMFKVKWLGDEEPTWEPWNNVRDNEVLHDFLRKQKQEWLVPKKIVGSV